MKDIKLKKADVKLYASLIIFALAILTTVPQLLETIKGLFIYISYFAAFCAPAFILWKKPAWFQHKTDERFSQLHYTHIKN